MLDLLPAHDMDAVVVRAPTLDSQRLASKGFFSGCLFGHSCLSVDLIEVIVGGFMLKVRRLWRVLYWSGVATLVFKFPMCVHASCLHFSAVINSSFYYSLCCR